MLDINGKRGIACLPAWTGARFEAAAGPNSRSLVFDRTSRADADTALPEFGRFTSLEPIQEQTAGSMTPTTPNLQWVEIAVGVLIGGLLLMMVAGLLLLRTGRREGRRPMGLVWNRIEARAHGARVFVEVDQLDAQRTLTINAVIQRGWSPELVRQVLGRPDYAVLDPQRRQEPLRFYDRLRVERAEQGKKFKQHRARVAREQARSDARIRKWVELRRLEEENAEQTAHDM